MDEAGYLLHWHGPFGSIAGLREWIRQTGHNAGLYVAFGYRDRARVGRPSFEYVGISTSLLTRVTNSHPTLRQIDISSIWVAQPANYSQRKRGYRRTLEICEWLMIHALGPSANDRKLTKPSISCSIINKFWTPVADIDGNWSQESKADRPEFIPDLIYFDEYDARVWYVRLERGSVQYMDS